MDGRTHGQRQLQRIQSEIIFGSKYFKEKRAVTYRIN